MIDRRDRTGGGAQPGEVEGGADLRVTRRDGLIVVELEGMTGGGADASSLGSGVSGGLRGRAISNFRIILAKWPKL